MRSRVNPLGIHLDRIFTSIDYDMIDMISVTMPYTQSLSMYLVEDKSWNPRSIDISPICRADGQSIVIMFEPEVDIGFAIYVKACGACWQEYHKAEILYAREMKVSCHESHMLYRSIVFLQQQGKETGIVMSSLFLGLSGDWSLCRERAAGRNWMSGYLRCRTVIRP